MGTPGVVILDVGLDQIPQLPLPHDDEPVQTLPADGSDKPFGIGVEVGTGDARGVVGDAVRGVLEAHQLGSVVVDEMNWTGTVFLERDDLLLDKTLGRELSNTPLDDGPGLEFFDEEDEEALPEGRLDGQKVAGEQRVPVSLEEPRPGTPRLKGPVATKPMKNPLDGSSAQNDRVLSQLALDLGQPEPGVEFLDREDQLPDGFGDGLATGFLARKDPAEFEEVAIPAHQSVGPRENESPDQRSSERREKGELEPIEDRHPRAEVVLLKSPVGDLELFLQNQTAKVELTRREE